MRWTRHRPSPRCRIISRNWTATSTGMKIGLPREYFEGLASETGDLIAKGVDRLQEAGLRGSRNQLAGHEVRHRLLLHHRHGGGQLESGALRRRPLYIARGIGNLERHVSRDARRGLRRGMQAAHHARNLRAQPRLLRCLLSEGAEGARADRAKISEKLSAKWMRSSLRCRPFRRSRSERRSTIRSKCIFPIFTPSRATWPASPV